MQQHSRRPPNISTLCISSFFTISKDDQKYRKKEKREDRAVVPER
jgi:hypothetical protein